MSAKKTIRIGLSACFFHSDPKRPIFKGKTLQYLEQSLAHWLMESGALVYMIPNPGLATPDKKSLAKIKTMVADLDGLVLQGGSDVSPKCYGEEALKPEWNGDYIRDLYEMALVKEFRKAKKPVLGVCRGAQLLNVAFGGTLYQDIETQVPGALNHRNWEIYDQLFHEIEIVPATGLAKISKVQKGKVNSIHHQAIKDLGKDLVVEAFSSKDKIIEAIRSTKDDYVFAVQWHPEFLDQKDKTLLDRKPILKEFLAAISRRKGKKK